MTLFAESTLDETPTVEVRQASTVVSDDIDAAFMRMLEEDIAKYDRKDFRKFDNPDELTRYLSTGV